jgi:hypothetical protein
MDKATAEMVLTIKHLRQRIAQQEHKIAYTEERQRDQEASLSKVTQMHDADYFQMKLAEVLDLIEELNISERAKLHLHFKLEDLVKDLSFNTVNGPPRSGSVGDIVEEWYEGERDSPGNAWEQPNPKTMGTAQLPFLEEE